MKRIKLLAVLGLLSLAACSEPGLGGTGSISGNVEHHGQKIPEAMVYIKYGATELPGTRAEDYDAQTLASTADGFFEFEELEKGNYYLYAVGYDASIFDSVFGGIGVRIKGGEAFSSDIPVTE